MSLLRLTVLESAHKFAAGIDQSPCDGCDQCGTRCTAGIRILRAEFEAIQDYRRVPTGDDVRRVTAQPKTQPIPGATETYEACRFRDVDRGRCAIYPVRPLICRLFGHVEWLPCPIEKVPHTLPGAVELMRLYATEPRHTYEEWLAQSAPSASSPR